MASLAGVGLTWYTWLEQGRDIRVSAAVLERIARALRLEGTKRFDHPKLGRLDLEYTPFEIAEQPSLRLYLFAPADSNTEAKLRAVLS